MAGERRKARAIRKAQQKTSRWTWYMVALFSFAVALLIFSTFWTQYRSIQQSNAPQISTSKVLVISGHPDLSSGSTSNRLIISELSALAGDDMSLSVRHIPSLYPDGKIDVAVEQASLLNADVIVLQFPFYWYMMPAPLKAWVDATFEFGFAFGTAHMLEGKTLLVSITTGGPADAYSPEGYNKFNMADLLTPFEAIAHMCRMVWAEPMVAHGMFHEPGEAGSGRVEAEAVEHGQAVGESVKQLLNASKYDV